MNIRNYLKKSAVTGFIKSIIGALVIFLFLPTIIRNIGMDNYGIIVLTLIISNSSGFLDLGTSKAVVFLIGKDKNNEGLILSSAVLFSMLIIVLVCLVLILFEMLNIKIFGSDLYISNQLINIIILLIILNFSITLLNNLLRSIMEAKYLVHFLNIGYIISSLTLYGFLYLSSIFIRDIRILIYIPIISSLIVVMYNVTIIKYFSKIKLSWPNRTYFTKMFFTSIKYFRIGLSSSIIIPMNKYLLTTLTGSTALLGVFELSLKIPQFLTGMLSSISVPLFGLISNLKEHDRNKIFRITSITSGIVFIFAIVIFILYYIYANNISMILDNNSANTIANTSIILLIGLLFSSFSEPMFRALAGVGHLKRLFYIRFSIPIINIAYLSLINFNNKLFHISIGIASSYSISAMILILYFFINFRNIDIE